MSLEKIAKQGRLVETFPLFERSTIQHADEIQADRAVEIKAKKDDAELPKQWFWTADFPMYKMEGKEAVLYMARNKDNLIFDNIVDATTQIREKNNYLITEKKSIDSVMSSDTTLRIALSDLKLKGDDSEWRYFEIDTKKYNALNKSQRLLAERIHGKGKAFENSMNMLSKAGIEKTTIYVLNPEYVAKNTSENSAIARVSYLGDFSGSSYFFAYSRNVDDYGRRLRGVLSKARSADAPKYYDVATVLEEASQTSAFAPDQIKKFQNTLNQGHYKIIKGGN